MAGPYDYTINIPQPPANNFLQSLLGIQQIKGLQQQSQLAEQQAAIQRQNAQFAQELQPLERQKLEAAISAQQASTTQSNAATGLLGVQTQAAQSTLEENQRKNQAVAAYQSEALKLAEDPTSWNATDLRKVAMKAAVLDPQSFTGLKNLFSELPQAGSILSNAASEVVLSVNAGKPEVALKSIDQYLTASQAALEKNPNDKAASAAVTFLEGAKKAVEEDPAAGALAASNFLFNTDPNKFDATAKALKAAGEVGETKAKSELQQAQAGLAKVDTELKQLKATAGLDPEEKMKQETLMRDNFQAQPLVRNYLIRQDNYGIIKTADKSPEGDRARITAFIKLHDPNSVVSVTESGQITSTTPVAQYQSWIAKFNNEGILGDTVRKSIDSQADKTIKSAESQFNTFKNNTASIAKRYGINPKNVVEIFDKQQEPAAPANGPTGAPGVSINTGTLPVQPDLTMPPAGAVRRVK